MNNTQAAFLRKALLAWYCQRTPAAFSIGQVAGIIQISPIADFKPEPADLTASVQYLVDRGYLTEVTMDLDNTTYYRATDKGVDAWERAR